MNDPIAAPLLTRDWDFVPSRATDYFRRQRIKDFLFRLRPAPRSKVIKAATPHPRWIVYFVYAPDGQLGSAHRFTLERLRASAMKLLVVCATPDPAAIPGDLLRQTDALVWKGLSGFDFSAFAVGLDHLARMSPGSDVLVMNDSILGPFADLDKFMDRARWSLTGFTASPSDENHIQSYAFILRGLSRRWASGLRSIFVPGCAFDRFDSVVRSQETRFARVAVRRMSVGSFWYSDAPGIIDPTRHAAGQLLDQGYPFIKKSLLGKFRRHSDPQLIADLERYLVAAGHPPFPD